MGTVEDYLARLAAKPSGGGDTWTASKLLARVTNTSASVNVVALTCTLPTAALPGEVYEVEVMMSHDVLVNTTGIIYRFTSGAGRPSLVAFGQNQTYNAVGGSSITASGDEWSSTGTVRTGGLPNPFWATGLVEVGTSSTSLLTVEFRSEVDLSEVGVRAGSYIQYRKIA